jgi:hypothetical protein
MMLAPTMLRVMERREQKVRLEVARLAREIAVKRENLATLDATIEAVDRRARENGSARFANGARTVAALLELEQNSQSLRAGREELEALRQQSEQALTTLIARQRSLSKQWRREEARLAHITRLMQRERMLADVRQFDTDEEAFAERYSVRPIHPPRAAGVR